MAILPVTKHGYVFYYYLQLQQSCYNHEGSNGLSFCSPWAGEADEKDHNGFSVSTWTDDMTENRDNDESTRSVCYFFDFVLIIIL